MQGMIWGGAAVTLVGVGLLGWCIRLAAQVRHGAADDPVKARAALTRVLYWNMAALGLASLGLMSMVVAIILR
jgi:hypothetical protein